MTTAAEWVAFLNARLDEDEANARVASAFAFPEDDDGMLRDPDRELREVAGKRARLDAYLAVVAELGKTDEARWREGQLSALRFAIERDAEVYSDHPDYPQD